MSAVLVFVSGHRTFDDDDDDDDKLLHLGVYLILIA